MSNQHTRPQNLLIPAVVLALGLSFSVTRAQAAVQTSVPAPSTSWQIGGTLYLWGAAMSGTTANDDPFNISFLTILKHLDMGFMGAFDARKDKFSFMVDLLYLSVSADKNKTVTLPVENQALDVDVFTSVKQKSWIVSPTGTYNLIDSKEGTFDVLAGARYLFLKPTINIVTTGPIATRSVGVSGSGDIWDGIVGIKGRIHLSQNWFLPYYADIGAGDSQLTRQALGGIAYHFQKADLILAYRYLDWEFKSNPLLNTLNLSGPVLGAQFVF